MKVRGTLRESDYVRSQFLHVRPRPIFAIIGTLLFILAVVMAIYSQSLILVGCLAYFLLWFLVFIPWRAKKHYRQYKAMSEPVCIEATDMGLSFESSTGRGIIPWDHVNKWRNNDKLLLVYPAGNVFHLVPRHFFSTVGQYEEFIARLQKNAGEST